MAREYSWWHKCGHCGNFCEPVVFWVFIRVDPLPPFGYMQTHTLPFFLIIQRWPRIAGYMRKCSVPRWGWWGSSSKSLSIAAPRNKFSSSLSSKSMFSQWCQFLLEFHCELILSICSLWTNVKFNHNQHNSCTITGEVRRKEKHRKKKIILIFATVI